MKWVDKTVYGDAEKPGLTAPRLFEMMVPSPVGQVTVFSGRAKNQSKDHWYLNCAALAMHSLELQASDHEEACQRSYDLVLNVCSSEHERWAAVMDFLLQDRKPDPSDEEEYKP